MTEAMATRVPPTVDQFKTWARRNQPVAKAVLLARAFAALERQRVDAYIAPIFASYGFTYGAIARGQLTGLIPTQKDLYLADDGPQMAAYYAECDAAHRAHGFTGPDGHCPALTAETLVRDAERALMDQALPLFGIEDVYGDDRAKYLELLIGACLIKKGAR
jgi:hypothetical protein